MTDDAVSQLRCAGLLIVATQTPAHVHVHHPVGFLHVSYIAVTLLAVQSRGIDVYLVAKVDESGHPIDPCPRDRFLAFPISSQFLNLWLVGGNDLVTLHALLDAGNAGRW
jgi:hypothetical protein